MMKNTDKKIYLIGDERTKRYSFFQKAAQQLDINFVCLPWSDYKKTWNTNTLEGGLVKIDPPFWQEADFQRMKEKMKSYRCALLELEDKRAIYLNAPGVILQMLDKRKCKKVLCDAGLAATKTVLWHVESFEHLLEQMEQQRCSSLFLKPVFGSGASGVMAFHCHPHKKTMSAYTSCHLENGKLYNTKKLTYLTEVSQIQPIVEQLCKMDIMAEHWYAKAEHKGKKYDLRVLFQFGKTEFIVARQSQGPITNLHLNNQALDYHQLALSKEQWDRIEALCREAAGEFAGCHMAGIDILLEKGSMTPYIIEMNGQGDLLYQDIYEENIIYKRQLQWFNSFTNRQ